MRSGYFVDQEIVGEPLIVGIQRDYWDELAKESIDASVIDPNDRRGAKNRYLAHIRDREILDALIGIDQSSIVLDLGCGTGSLSAAISASGRSVIGLDISPGLLKRTSERALTAPALFARYDGFRFPLTDSCLEAITTYVVLNHLLAVEQLGAVLSECNRVLRHGGRMVCIEQIRAVARLDEKEWKHQRRREEFLEAFERAGLKLRHNRTIRYGHFPTTALVRAGLIPRRAFDYLAGLEKVHGRLRPHPRRDYADVLFVLEKPDR